MDDADLPNSKEAQDAADDLKFLREEADNYYGEIAATASDGFTKASPRSCESLSAGHS